MSASIRRFAVVPCAGLGARAGAGVPKQYRQIGGRPMLWHTLQPLLASPLLAQTLVVIAADDRYWDALAEDPALATALEAGRLRVARCGGASRHESVSNGLRALRDGGAVDDDWVMVHDAARPGLTVALIAALIAAVGDDAAGGILALPVADTLKRAQQQRIAGTASRDGLWQAQTPQLFALGLLAHALGDALAAGAVVTDEASAVERIGLSPQLVPGSLRNFKVTYAEDFVFAQDFLEHRDDDS